MQHDAAGLFQLGNDGARAIASRLDDADALVDDGLGIGAVVGRVERGQERNVDAKGVLGHGAAACDFLAQVGGRGEDEARDDAQSAGVGDGGGEFGVADVLERESGSAYTHTHEREIVITYHHAALHNRDCDRVSVTKQHVSSLSFTHAPLMPSRRVSSVFQAILC